jgi:ABC-type branched-subunit amino acid transport system substrate-binding protein
LLKRYLLAAGYARPLLGGDGITNDPYWLTAARAGAGDTYGTIAGPDISVLTSPRARAFVSAYDKFVAVWPENTLSPWSVMAYDAANTLINSISMAIEHGDGSPLSSLRALTGEYLASAKFE